MVLTAHLFQIALFAVASFICIRAWPLTRDHQTQQDSQNSSHFLPRLILSCGLILRVCDLTQLSGGQLTMDELSITRILNTGLLTGNMPYNGATNATHSLLVLAWQWLFGISPLAVRIQVVTMGMLGLLCLFLAIRRLGGSLLAVWTTALLSISLYGSYLNKMAVETGTLLFYVPLLILLYSHWRTRPSIFLSASIGFIFSASLFTYPAYSLGALAYFLVLTTAASFYYFRKRPNLDRTYVKGFCVGSFFFCLSLAAFFFWHLKLSTSPTLLFLSPGVPTWKTGDYFFSVYKILYELLITCDSPMTFFPAPFLEPFLLPFFVAGLLELRSKQNSKPLLAIAFCIPLTILLSALGSNLPGARRAIFILIPFYFFSARGILKVMPRIRQPALGVVFTHLSLFYLIWFHFCCVSPMSRQNFYPGFWALDGKEKVPISDTLFLDEIRNHDLVVIGDPHWMEIVYYESFKRLAEFLKLIPPNTHDIEIFDPNQIESLRAAFPKRRQQALIWMDAGNLKILQNKLNVALNCKWIPHEKKPLWKCIFRPENLQASKS